MSMGRYHFEEIAAAPQYPLAVASAAAIAALIGLLAVRSRSGGALFGAVNPGLLLSLVIAAGLTYLLRKALLPEAHMFSAVAIGLGSAFVLSLIAQLRPTEGADEPAGAAAGVEAVVLAALVSVPFGSVLVGMKPWIPLRKNSCKLKKNSDRNPLPVPRERAGPITSCFGGFSAPWVRPIGLDSAISATPPGWRLPP